MEERRRPTARAGPLAVAACVAGLGLFVLIGAFRIPGEAAYAGVGPRAFPIAIGGALALLGVALGVAIARGMVLRGEAAEDADPTRPPDRAAVVWLVAGVAISAAALERAGFALTAALLFAWTARAFGSRRLLRDVVLGLVLGAATFLVFARGLGVSLPAGPLSLLAG